MAESETRVVFKERFNKCFEELISSKDSNSFYITGEKYRKFLQSVKYAKTSVSKTSMDYHCLKQFNVFTVGGS